jgi:DNA (cytosine-5)-methyltransferase 1
MKFVDFFCGMGTIRMGFEQAGHECVYSVEFDKHKREIYKVIFGSEPDAGDIRTVRASDIPRSDCWCFGAPCQDFSIAGLRAGLDGERSGLVREVFRLVREKEPADRPEWLLYENVKGMLSSNNGWDFAAIQAEMGQLGYDVEWCLLNSKNFGVPQNRERVYTLGHLRTRGERKVFPIGECNSASDKSCNPASEKRQWVSPTLYTRPHRGDGTYVLCNSKIRTYTPRESMRLQGVPDYITDKLIAAGISDTQMYRAAGDACTVNVIYEIARRL